MEQIANNSLACVEDLTNDLELLESTIKPPRKKLKRSKPTPRQRRVFPESDDDEIVDISASEGS